MNITTITSKTGLTALFSLLGTALGMYTGTVPIVVGAQTIITALLALFLRDAVTKNAVEIQAVKAEAISTRITVKQVSRVQAEADDQRRNTLEQQANTGGAA